MMHSVQHHQSESKWIEAAKAAGKAYWAINATSTPGLSMQANVFLFVLIGTGATDMCFPCLSAMLMNARMLNDASA